MLSGSWLGVRDNIWGSHTFKGRYLSRKRHSSSSSAVYLSFGICVCHIRSIWRNRQKRGLWASCIHGLSCAAAEQTYTDCSETETTMQYRRYMAKRTIQRNLGNRAERQSSSKEVQRWRRRRGIPRRTMTTSWVRTETCIMWWFVVAVMDSDSGGCGSTTIQTWALGMGASRKFIVERFQFWRVFGESEAQFCISYREWSCKMIRKHESKLIRHLIRGKK